MIPKMTYCHGNEPFCVPTGCILIGEMRDEETASIGVEASLTGHVLSTLHTNSAPETITRLLDLGLDPVNFSTPCWACWRRLMRTLCPK